MISKIIALIQQKSQEVAIKKFIFSLPKWQIQEGLSDKERVNYIKMEDVLSLK